MSSEYKYVRTNSKGEKIFRRDTNETFEYVEKYLESKDIYYKSRRGGSMMWIFIDDKEIGTYRQYVYYPTTGRWNSWKSNGFPKKHYRSNGIEDFLIRFGLIQLVNPTKYGRYDETGLKEIEVSRHTKVKV